MLQPPTPTKNPKTKQKFKKNPNTKYNINTKNHYESFIKLKLTQTYSHKFQ